jgi:hypothetical protein
MTTVPQLPTHSGVLGPPRFSLRAMLIAVSALCCMFAVMAAAGVVWSMAILLLITLVGAHVLGNSLGTKLRDEATREALAKDGLCETVPRPVQPLTAPPRLAERARLHRAIGLTSMLAGGAGAELGGMLAAYTYPEASIGAVALGVVSLAVLGGLAGFAASSFLSIARQALREATAPSSYTAEASTIRGRNPASS